MPFLRLLTFFPPRPAFLFMASYIMNCTAGLRTRMREGRVPFHRVPTPSLAMICEKASERESPPKRGVLQLCSNKKINMSDLLNCNALHTKYAPVVGLLKVFVSELCPLQLQSSVDHPHGSGQDHIHHPFMDNKSLAILNPSPCGVFFLL